METNVVVARFTGYATVTDMRYRWDYGQKLKVEGIADLPDYFEVHFSNAPSVGTAKVWLGQNGVVDIPDEYLATGEPVYAWIFLHAGETDGETVYSILIPVKKRPKPVNDAPTPVQKSELDTAIAILQTASATATEQATIATGAATTATEAAETATSAATTATEAAETATSAVADVEAAATRAEQAAEGAEASATDAQAAARSAELSAQTAQLAKSAAETAAANAEQSATDAGNYAGLAEAAEQDAQAAKTAAEASATAAAASETAAQTAQTAAEAAKDTAVANATTATTKAAEAAQSASSAADSETAAEAAATRAEQAAASLTVDSALSETSKNPVQNKVVTGAVADLKSATNEKGPAIMQTVTDQAIANFADGADDLPMKSVKVMIEPKQDLHGYDSPWPAGGGKNLLDINNIVVGNTNNWSVDVNGDTLTVTHKTAYTSGTPTFAFNRPSGTYVISIGSINIIGQVSLYVNGLWAKTINNGDTFTIDAANTNEIKFSAHESQATIITKIQIESGTTATAYAPYSNICPISGWDSVTVTRTGKNIWDEEWELGGIVNATGAPYATSDRIRSKNFCACLPNTNYYFRNGTIANQMVLYWYDADKNYIRYDARNNQIDTSPSNARYFKIVRIGNTYNHDISINYPSTDTDYHAYNGETYSITFPTEAGTVYGGTLDVVTGELVVVKGYIASYSGESIGDPWISDRDAYTAGATPTTGAQVVYTIATPTTYHLTTQEVKTLLGQNNIFADTGNVTVTYPTDTKMYIDDKIAALQALVLENISNS